MNFLSSLFTTPRNNASKKTNVPRTNVPRTNAVNPGFTTGPKQVPNQAGGVAPANFEYPANMRQPSESVLEWATTAGLPTPVMGMRNVAHGGRRKNKNKSRKNKLRKNKSRKNKSRKNKSRKNKSRKNKSRKNKNKSRN